MNTISCPFYSSTCTSLQPLHTNSATLNESITTTHLHVLSIPHFSLFTQTRSLCSYSPPLLVHMYFNLIPWHEFTHSTPLLVSMYFSLHTLDHSTQIDHHYSFTCTSRQPFYTNITLNVDTILSALNSLYQFSSTTCLHIHVLHFSLFWPL